MAFAGEPWYGAAKAGMRDKPGPWTDGVCRVAQVGQDCERKSPYPQPAARRKYPSTRNPFDSPRLAQDAQDAQDQRRYHPPCAFIGRQFPNRIPEPHVWATRPWPLSS